MANEKILERIRRLLAMSKDTSSPHEAAIAARRVRKMMDDHQVSELDVQKHTFNTNDFGDSVYQTKNKRKVARHTSLLAIAVAKLNDCRVYTVVSEGTIGIQYKGFIADTATAQLLLDYLLIEAKNQAFWNANGRADILNFKYGFAMGVRDKIKEIMIERKKIQLSNGKSLVVCKDSLITKQYGVQKYGRSSRANYSGSNKSFNKGYMSGQSVSLNTKVN